MKQLLIIFFIYSTTIYSHSKIDDWAKEIIPQEMGADGVYFTNLVSRRFYFIQRLTPIMNVLLQHQSLIDTNGFGVIEVNRPTHPKMKQVMRRVKDQYELRPLFMVWNDFKSYKSLEDQILIEDFTKEVLIISLNLVRNHKKLPSSEAITRLLSQTDSPTINRLISNYNEQSKKLKSENNNLTDIDMLASINQITHRFYIVNRLEFAIELIKSIHQKYTVTLPNFFIDPNIKFCTPCIINCRILINNNQSLEALIKLCNDAQHFKYIKEENFNHDFSVFLFSFYVSLLKNNFHVFDPITKRNAVQALFQIYSHIESLPLEEILDAIDMITEELPPLLEKFELKEKMNWKEWKAWFKKYWWVPPVVICIYGIRLALLFKSHQRAAAPSFMHVMPGVNQSRNPDTLPPIPAFHPHHINLSSPAAYSRPVKRRHSHTTEYQK